MNTDVYITFPNIRLDGHAIARRIIQKKFHEQEGCKELPYYVHENSTIQLSNNFIDLSDVRESKRRKIVNNGGITGECSIIQGSRKSVPFATEWSFLHSTGGPVCVKC